MPLVRQDFTALADQALASRTYSSHGTEGQSPCAAHSRYLCAVFVILGKGPRADSSHVGYSMNNLIIRVCGIGHNVFHPAIKNKAKIIDRRRVQWFVLAKFVNNSTGNIMFLNKRVGSFIRPLQSFPKWRINDQLATSFKILIQFYEVVAILTIFRFVTLIIFMTILNVNTILCF